MKTWFFFTFIYNVNEIYYRDLSMIYFHCIILDILMLKQAVIWTAGYKDTWILYMPPDQHELTGPWEIQSIFQMSNFQADFSGQWLWYLLWKYPRMNVTGPYLW